MSRHPFRRLGAAAVALALGVGTAALVAAPADAAPPEGVGSWAQWSLAGAAGGFTGTMTLGHGFPTASFTSDSLGGAALPTGASTWLNPGTAIGAKYGTSRNNAYLNLRPKANNATTPSTTTYTFAAPTPAAGWAFALGDIDSDKVTISAKDSRGVPIPAGNIGARLGFKGTFNYCDVTVTPKPSCTAKADGSWDLPVWDTATATLKGSGVDAGDAPDTDGATGWFEPTISLSSLTFTFTREQGFPVYQTWFASLARDITGTVTVPAHGSEPSAPKEGVALTLLGPDGKKVADATTDADGNYSFPGYTAADGYEVVMTPPSGFTSDDPTSQPADLTDADAVADFTVREIVPAAISGTVLDDDGNPVPGVTVTLHGPGGSEKTATTGADGGYLFDDNPAGGYTVGIAVPRGYTSDESTLPPFQVVVPPVGDPDPITGKDFTLAANPDVSGKVTAGGSPVAGVTVQLTDLDGREFTTSTDADGAYDFSKVAPGGGQVSIEVPGGYQPVDGVDTRDYDTSAGDATGVDFELAKPGSVSGQVTTGGVPVPGVTVTLTAPDGTEVALTTDSEGEYFVGGLIDDGGYTVTVTVPEGYEPDGVTEHAFAITPAGESVGGQDFALTLSATTAPPTTGEPTTDAPTTGEPTTDAPTTGEPTTDAPTTGAPTTGAPTSGAPTTADPTDQTGAPTGAGPATSDGGPGAGSGGDGGQGDGIARTGTEIGLPLGGAAALLLLGGGVAWFARRSARRH